MPVSRIKKVVPISSIGSYPSAVNPSLLRVVNKIYRVRQQSSVLYNLSKLRLEELKQRAASLGIKSVEGNDRTKEPWILAIQKVAAMKEPPLETALRAGALLAQNAGVYM